jgi:hypothetical protein
MSQRESNDHLYNKFLDWLKIEYGTISTFRPRSEETPEMQAERTSSLERPRALELRTPICEGIVEKKTYTQRKRLAIIANALEKRKEKGLGSGAEGGGLIRAAQARAVAIASAAQAKSD